ncbi:hypothetical protein [uncultured Draconibacterium sp.]|uniref:hypothetical protein n=1 Tax=uncultured Draconibacterium sp. TaxID=1573823 RepID=UPI0025F31122|nr:hypothetical protein [uncultured Draconibacterium sp.]
MKKHLLTLTFLFLLIVVANSAMAQTGLTGYYDILNWTLIENSGSIITSNAPDEITFVSGNSGYEDDTYMTITAPNDGIVSFEWDYTTVDGAEYDYPFYIIDGDKYTFSTYNESGSNSQSGTESFVVTAGQTFGFGASTTDGIVGSATIKTFTFSFPPGEPVPVSIFSILALFALIGGVIVFKLRKRIFNIA